jgi:Transposase DDE domain
VAEQAGQAEVRDDEPGAPCTKALRTRDWLTMCLDRDMAWQAPASGKPRRPATYSDAAVRCGLTIKVLFGVLQV